jgi:hypothetical protein
VSFLCEQLKTILDPNLNESGRRVAAEDSTVRKKSKKVLLENRRNNKNEQGERECYANNVRLHANLPLPRIPVETVFYNRQLWIREFVYHT